MDLSILVRGQSNAALFMQSGAAEELRVEVQRALGYDGTRDRVHLLGGDHVSIRSGAPFLFQYKAELSPWVQADGHGGWNPLAKEATLLDYLRHLPREVRVSPVLTVWMHNEVDVYNWAIEKGRWAASIRYDAGQVRNVLGQGTGTTPYLFIWIPANFPPQDAFRPEVDWTAQTLKSDFASLVGDSAFHALSAPVTSDLDMSFGENLLVGDGKNGIYQPGPNGGLHMSAADARWIVSRLAYCIANAFSPYARPGAAAAGGRMDCPGLTAAAAQRSESDPGEIRVSFAPNPISGPIAPLGPEAAAGAGWIAATRPRDPGIAPARVERQGPDLLVLHFAQPPAPGARIYYGFGLKRIAVGHGKGEGAAAYDAHGVPVRLPVEGLDVAPALHSHRG